MITGPIEIDVKVHLLHPETGDTAIVTYGLSPGKVPGADSIREALNASLKAGERHGMVLMGAETFFNHVLVKKKFGRVGNFATPSEFRYDHDLPTADVPHVEFDDEDDMEDDED